MIFNLQNFTFHFRCNTNPECNFWTYDWDERPYVCRMYKISTLSLDHESTKNRRRSGHHSCTYGKQHHKLFISYYIYINSLSLLIRQLTLIDNQSINVTKVKVVRNLIKILFNFPGQCYDKPVMIESQG